MMGTQSWSPRFIRILLAALVVVFLVAWGEREASADFIHRSAYEVLILRLEKPAGEPVSSGNVCTWWYFVWVKDSNDWALLPVIPEGWLTYYGCEATALYGEGAFMERQ